MKKVILFAGALSILITQSGCFGSFGLVRTIYEFNDGVSENKVVKTILFYGLLIVPVYSIAGFLDIVLFNLIEFWSGSNPIAMEAGQVEEQLMTIKGETYKVKATKNKMEFTKITDGELIEMGAMVFDTKSKSWSFVKDGEAKEIVSFDTATNTVDYFTSEGVKTVDVSIVECLVIDKVNSNPSFYMANK